MIFENSMTHAVLANEDLEVEWFMVQVTSGDACWLVQRNFENFRMLDAQLHQCIFDRKISQLQDLASQSPNDEDLEVRMEFEIVLWHITFFIFTLCFNFKNKKKTQCNFKKYKLLQVL